MSIFVHYQEGTRLVSGVGGFFNSDDHSAIPVPSIEVTEQQRLDALKGERQGNIYVNETFDGLEVLAPPDVIASYRYIRQTLNRFDKLPLEVDGSLFFWSELDRQRINNEIQLFDEDVNCWQLENGSPDGLKVRSVSLAVFNDIRLSGVQRYRSLLIKADEFITAGNKTESFIRDVGNWLL